MSKPKQSFLDSNTILAMVLTFVIFIGWQKYMDSKYPKAPAAKTTDLTASEYKNNFNVKEGSKFTPVAGESDTPTLIEPKSLYFEDEFWSFRINSKGMSVDAVTIKKINKVATKPYVFKNSKSFYPTAIDGKILDFDFSKVDNYKYKGTALYKNKKIVKTVIVDSNKFSFDVEIKIKGAKTEPFSIDHLVVASVQEPKNKIFFLPAFERNEFFVTGSLDEERKILTTKNVTEEPELFPSSKIVSVGDEYFAAALLNKGKILPDVSFNQNQKRLDLKASYAFTSSTNLDTINYSLFIGPKNIELLSSVSPDLLGLINFMYLGFIARPILKGLDLLYGIIGNYGWAVVILTLLIRLLIMPLTVSSLKSMKRMQVIQPELKRIKEKYKTQPQLVNQKTMELMKNNKVNPLGGCLPMLLQMPIFFAFYRGLSESVDLYQAPFFWWIDDLSKMDPYFIFPILSMVGMTVHQLVTPSNMDKLQRKMMLLMPIVFGAFLITLPSALTLYMAVGAWFGILQHMIFLREKTAV